MLMETMREILKKLMAKAGHTPYDIERISGGLPAATTYRFLSGKITQPNNDTIKAWMKVYGVTESQLRGFEPIHGVDAHPIKVELEDLLPPEEYNHVKRMRSLDESAKAVVYRIAAMLAEPQSSYCSDPLRAAERRVRNEVPNPQSRAGEIRHKSPPVRRRLKNLNDRHADGRKTSQSA